VGIRAAVAFNLSKVGGKYNFKHFGRWWLRKKTSRPQLIELQRAKLEGVRTFTVL